VLIDVTYGSYAHLGYSPGIISINNTRARVCISESHAQGELHDFNALLLSGEFVRRLLGYVHLLNTKMHEKLHGSTVKISVGVGDTTSEVRTGYRKTMARLKISVQICRPYVPVSDTN